MNSSRHSFLIAGLLILGGALLLLSNLDLIDINLSRYIFKWQSILMIVGLIIFIRKENRKGIILIAVGGFFLMVEFVSDLYVDLWDLWPGLLIFIGATLITQRRTVSGSSSSEGEVINDMAIFGGNHVRVESTLSGGTVTAIFGGSTVDIRRVTLGKGPNDINLFALFGGSKIIVPEALPLKIEVSPILGELADKRRVIPEAKGDKYLNIKGIVIFGGGEIVN